MSASLNPSLALGEPPGEEWDGEQHPKHARPWLFGVPMLLYIHGLGLILLELRPTGKLLLIPAGQAGSLGRVLVESKLGALSGDMLAEREGSHQSRALLPNQTLCHLCDLFPFS